jgi:hypothetical protein
MKTSIKTLTTICTVIISLSASAQRNHNGNQPQSNNQPQNNNKKIMKDMAGEEIITVKDLGAETYQFI